MTTVVIRLLCAAIILVVMAITDVILETLGRKRVKIFRNGVLRWTLSFVLGIVLFLSGVKFIFT